MKKTIIIQVLFWLLMAVSFVCELNYDLITQDVALNIIAHLCNTLLIAIIMFYIGYGFSSKFLFDKKKYLYIGIVVFVYLLIALTPFMRVHSFTPLQITKSVVSGFIDNFAWFAGGIVTRQFFRVIKKVE